MINLRLRKTKLLSHHVDEFFFSRCALAVHPSQLNHLMHLAFSFTVILRDKEDILLGFGEHEVETFQRNVMRVRDLGQRHAFDFLDAAVGSA